MLGLPPRNGQWTAGLNHSVLRNDLTLTLFNNVIMRELLSDKKIKHIFFAHISCLPTTILISKEYLQDPILQLCQSLW